MIDIHLEIQTLRISWSLVKSPKWVSRLGHVSFILHKGITTPKATIFYIHSHTNVQDPIFSGGRDASTSEVRMAVVLIIVPLGN